MGLPYLYRSDLRIFIICTLTGGILQIAARKYLKKHPEFSEDKPVTKRRPGLPFPRGGALLEITGVKVLVTIVALKVKSQIPQSNFKFYETSIKKSK